MCITKISYFWKIYLINRPTLHRSLLCKILHRGRDSANLHQPLGPVDGRHRGTPRPPRPERRLPAGDRPRTPDQLHEDGRLQPRAVGMRALSARADPER